MKTINHPCHKLKSYLMSKEAFSQQEAQNYSINHGAVDLLRQERSLEIVTERASEENCAKEHLAMYEK